MFAFSVAVALTMSGNFDSAAERPNVLFIAVDDMRVELGCYGSEVVKSPNIDRLAAWGTRFESAYCQQAVCNPSRASVMTGLRPTSLGIYDLTTHFREKRPSIKTLPQCFLTASYTTQNIGKIFHNWRQDDYRGDPSSWSVPAVLHYGTHGDDKPQVASLPPDLLGLPRAEIFDVGDEAYLDGRIAGRAVTALQELQDQPFFLAVGFWKPHAPFNAPKAYWDIYARESIPPATPNSPPSNVPEIAMHDSREILRGFKNRPGGRPTASEARALRHGYLAAISYVDAQIGKVLDELERLGLREKTIVVFWSDHGFHLGEKTLWAKTSNFELDARVPLIIADPSLPAGRSSSSIVELLDLYPTIIDLCRLPAPHHLEGESLRPLLMAELVSVASKDDADTDAVAYTTHPRPAYPTEGQPPEAMGYSVRHRDYRYTEWRDFDTGRLLAAELYDHRSGHDESANVISDPKFRALADIARTRLLAAFPRVAETP